MAVNTYTRAAAGAHGRFAEFFVSAQGRLPCRRLWCAVVFVRCLQAVTTDEVMDLVEKHLKTQANSKQRCEKAVLAILQFCRFANGRAPQSRPLALQPAISRADEWQVKATKEDRKRGVYLLGF